MDNELNDRMDLLEREWRECDDWFDSHEKELYVAPDKRDQLPPFRYLFDDYEKAKQFVINKKLQNTGRILTLIEEDGDMYVIRDYHFVNRLGYFFLKKPLGLEEDFILRWG